MVLRSDIPQETAKEAAELHLYTKQTLMLKLSTKTIRLLILKYYRAMLPRENVIFDCALYIALHRHEQTILRTLPSLKNGMNSLTNL